MLQSERDAVAQDIYMLTTFASAQRFTDLNESPFSSSRADANFLTINKVRHPPSQATLQAGLVHPSYNPFIEGAQRSSGVLDALATLFGSGEAAIAVACVIDHQGQSVNLIVAANRDISNQKVREIVELWEGLKKISDTALKINADSTPSEYHPESHKIFNSPSADKFAKDKSYLGAQKSFVLTALRQNKKKVIQRVQKYSAVLKNLDQSIRPKIRPFLGIARYLEIFKMLHTFIVQILEDLSVSENDYDLNGIFFLLEELQAEKMRIDMEDLQSELLRNANDRSPAELRTIFKIKRAFSKPLMTRNAITKLVKLARSPNTGKIFRIFEFRPVYLEGQKAPILPENPAVWKDRFNLMGIAGSRHDDQNDQKNLSICIDQAIASRGTVAVHAEVKILSYMHKKRLMRKAMNNIGVSKLCYPGCFEFARAIQKPEVIIAGQHRKWYPFPCVAELEFPSDSQLEGIRQELLRTFKHDWGQYTLRKRTASFGNHPDSSTISSGQEELTRDPDNPFTIQGFKNSLLLSSKGKESAHKRKDS